MISKKILNQTKNGSMIRAMFEEGARLRKLYGADKVYDFSLGNPDYEPPQSVKNSLKKYISEDKPGVHAYMSNAGFPDVRQKVAESLSKETGLSIALDNIVMTCGAAGGLNVVLKTILDPNDEVILFAPYFVEYNTYADNHGGKTVVVPADLDTFEPNLIGLEKAITPKT
ncbi:MAG: aspartate aminotransferase, partial [Clostridiales bacterium]|nr:aspartate aminotransferase [Clostridiales bacterium]